MFLLTIYKLYFHYRFSEVVSLQEHITQFTSNTIVEAIEEISKIVPSEELKQSVALARELHKITERVIIKSESKQEGDTKLEINGQHIHLLEKLQQSLAIVQWDVLEKCEDIKAKEINFEEVVAVSIQLQRDLKQIIMVSEKPRVEEVKPGKFKYKIVITFKNG